jgi:Putative zinc-finger
MNCVSENILRAYQDGELDAAGRAEVEKHVATCDACEKRLREMAATSAMVSGRLSALDAGPADGSVDAAVALARFKARHDSGVERPAAVTRMFDRRWRPAWVTAVAATIIFAALTFPSGRSLAQRFLATLRIEKVQPITVDFSALDGNRPLGEMLSKMLSDKVVVTADEKLQHVDSAKAASELAGFPAQLLHARTDTPKFSVQGRHAFHVTVDRERLQDVVDQAGRPDLLVPATIDGAMVSVNVPRSIALHYGECERHVSSDGATADRTPKERHEWGQAGTEPNTCLALIEAPVPQVDMPADLNIQQLAEIGFQLTRMSPTQARELAQTIDWKSTLVLPIPRRAGTFSQVAVAGTQATLITNNGGRRGPDYVLIWVKNGIIYGLVGHGDASEAVTLANSLS